MVAQLIPGMAVSIFTRTAARTARRRRDFLARMPVGCGVAVSTVDVVRAVFLFLAGVTGDWS